MGSIMSDRILDDVKYTCPDCGGADITASVPCWIQANNPDDADHWEPDPEADVLYYLCQGCNQSHIDPVRTPR